MKGLKQTIKILLVAVCLLSIHNSINAANIEFEISNTSEKYIYLCMHKGPDFEIIDTLFSESGVFKYSSKKSLPHGVYFVIIPPYTRFDIIIADEQNFKIKLDASKINETITSTGEVQYSYFLEMQKEIAEINKLIPMLNMEKEIFKNIKPDTLSFITNKIDSLNSIQAGLYKKYQSLLTPDKFFYKMLKAMEPFEVPDEIEKLTYTYPHQHFRYYADHHFDRVDFSDATLLNTPKFVFHRLLEEFCRYFIDNRVNNLEEVYNDIDSLIAKTNDNEAYKQYILNYMVARYENPSNLKLEAVFVYLYRKYYMIEKPEWVSGQAYAILKFRAEALQNNLIGITGKDLILPDVNGKSHSIYGLNSEYKVILFWEPDCDFCSDMALELKDVYENLQSQNIEVFAVLSGSDVESWADFVNEHELKWINVYDPDKSSNYETYYGTFKTPRIYLLDNANEILAKDIKPASILAFIKDYENKKFNSNSPFEFIFGR